VIACYMAFKGVALFGVAPILAVQVVVTNDSLAVPLMLGITLLSGGIPFGRALVGQVWLDGGHICSRNPFRTLRYPDADVGGLSTRALRQNFFEVVALEPVPGRRDRPQRLVPVPSDDMDAFALRLDAEIGREGPVARGRKDDPETGNARRWALRRSR